MTANAVDAEHLADPRRFGGWRRELRAFVELFALTGVAIVQPTLDSLRRNSNDIFVPVGASAIQVVALVALMLLGPPLLLWAVEALIGVALPRLRRYAHAVLVGAVVGLIIVEVLNRQFDLGAVPKVVVAVLLGVGAALLVLRFSVAGMFLRYLAFAPVVFVVLFLLNSQINPLVLGSGVASTPSVRARKPSRIVMIVLDELPTESMLDGTGHIDAGLFPNIAKLAAGATWYRNNTSVAPYTQVAVPAILTSKYPTKPRGLSTASVHPHNLFTMLRHDYHINAHETLETLDPSGTITPRASVRALAHTSYTLWRDFVTNSDPDPAITSTTMNREVPALQRFTASLGHAPDKQLDYVHVLLPHYPWHLLPDGRSYSNTSAIPGLVGIWGGGPELAAVGRQRHILQLQAADRFVGEALDKLRRDGDYNRSLIVLTADHGEGFTAQNPIREATPANYSQIMWVPLIMKSPGQTAGRVDDRMSRSIDVLPTIGDMIGAKIPWKVDGRSLLGPAHPNGPRRFLEITSPDASTPPTQAKYQDWDGVKGFAQVLASRAAEPGPVQDLRVYEGFSKYGSLVGRPAAPLVTPGSPLHGSIGLPELWQNVDVNSAYAPWTYLSGRVDTPGTREIAVTVNGTIASLTKSFNDTFFGNAAYAALLPPSLFRPGANNIQMYTVTGDPASPHLQLIKRLN